MRKIEQQLKAAWQAGQPLYISNSSVVPDDDGGVSLSLHGNRIAHKDSDGVVRFTLAGWNTLTTRSRLNNVIGVNVHNLYGSPYLNSEPINSHTWYVKA